MKCHVFTWDFNCYHISLHDHTEFQDVFEQEVCKELERVLGKDGDPDIFYSINTFDPEQGGEVVLYFPAEHYNETELDVMFTTIDRAADDYLGGWSFQQDPDEDI